MGTHPIFESDFDCLTEKNMTSAVDEEIIRKRLLLDGEGAGDDRKLTMILKSFLKWCNNPDADKASYQKILYMLDQAEYQIKKLELVAKANNAQQEKYKKIEKEIENEMTKANHTIEQATKDLEDAKKHKSNQMEYDALAQIITKNKDRKTTQAQIDLVQSQTDQLRVENESLDGRLSDRRRELHVLLHGLESQLKSEEAQKGGQLPMEE